MPFDDRTPNPVDIHVGSRLRLRRKLLGLSQSDLGDALKLTFQQVQKYERGSNRVSASKLYEAAKMLKAPVSYFFEGYGDDTEGECEKGSRAEQAVNAFLTTAEGIELAQAFPSVQSSKHRRKILDLVRSLAEED
jgi:transcriptional regulator with XRE-family HTH domain